MRTAVTVAGKSRRPCASCVKRAWSSADASFHSLGGLSGFPASPPGPRVEFTRSPTRNCFRAPIRAKKAPVSCGNEIVFFLKMCIIVFRTVQKFTCMKSSATRQASVTVAWRNNHSSCRGKFQPGSIVFRKERFGTGTTSSPAALVCRACASMSLWQHKHVPVYRFAIPSCSSSKGGSSFQDATSTLQCATPHAPFFNRCRSSFAGGT